jgi:ditrans,polycis-polyprenyl diphosphate synthase
MKSMICDPSLSPVPSREDGLENEPSGERIPTASTENPPQSEWEFAKQNPATSPPTARGETDLDAQRFNDGLFTRGDPPLDILIRTSAVTRLSDFMLSQCNEQTQLVFLDCFWPEIRFWHVAFAVLQWRASLPTAGA